MSEGTILVVAGRTHSRRAFFRVAGASAAASALVLAGCKKDTTDPTPAETTTTLIYQAGDVGVLNYAYSLTQLELAFFEAVVKAFPSDMPASERAGFVDMRDHELIYSEFFKSIIPATSIIPTLIFTLTSLSLTTRAGVLAAAKKFTDLSTAAYNDMGLRLTASTTGSSYLLLLSKIASVKARHAAYVRDLLMPNSFAADDVVSSSGDFSGFGDTKTPAQVIEVLAPFFPVTVSTVNFL